MAQPSIRKFFTRVSNGDSKKPENSTAKVSDWAKPGTSKQCIEEDNLSPAIKDVTRKRKRSKGGKDGAKSKRIPMQDLPDPVNGENQLRLSPSNTLCPVTSGDSPISSSISACQSDSPTTKNEKPNMVLMMEKVKKETMGGKERIMMEKTDEREEDKAEEKYIEKKIKIRKKKKTLDSESDRSESSEEKEEKEMKEVVASLPCKKSDQTSKRTCNGKRGRPKGSGGKQNTQKVEQMKEELVKEITNKLKKPSTGSIGYSGKESGADENKQGMQNRRLRRISSSSEDEEKHKPSPSSSASSKCEEESSGKANHPFFGICKDGLKKEGSNITTGKAKEFDPSKSKYHPIDDAIWSRGENVPYLALARTLELIEGTNARLKIVDIMANYLRSVILLSPEDLLPSLYLCLNRLAPAWEGLELGVAETTLMRAIAQSTGRTISGVKEEAVRKGDLGLVAEGARGSQSQLSFVNMASNSRLTVSRVISELKIVASLSGQASMSKKLYRIVTLFVACRGPEMRYLVRSLSGKLRIGLAEQSVLQALALACTLSPPAQKSNLFPPPIIDSSMGKGLTSEIFKSKVDTNALLLKTAYCECPSFERLVETLLDGGIGILPERCKLSPGLPPKPMLAHPTKGVAEVLTRFDSLTFTCEYKYDGERAQIHLLEDGSIKIFSRNQEDNTTKYPDVIARLTTCFRTCHERDEEEVKIAKEKAETSEESGSDKSETKEGNEEIKKSYNEESNNKKISLVNKKTPSELVNGETLRKNGMSKEADKSDMDEEAVTTEGSSSEEGREVEDKGESSVKTCILDCEAVAWDVETECILPFQKLATRKRKDANESEIKVQVCLYLFDLLYLNGKSLVSEPLANRRNFLHTHFKRVSGHFEFACSIDTSSTEEVESFLEEAIKGNCEGLMVKTLTVDATYQIARRSRNWLKLKKDYLEGGGSSIGDSLDLVVIGGYPGKGKRTGNYGGFLLACYDPDSETYQTICKIGTGFSEEDLASLSDVLRPNALSEPRPYFSISPGLHPLPRDWFDPFAVWEVKCADLSLSPVHHAGIGLVDPEKGISLRFPRFKRVRDDKKPEEATSAEQVAEMYNGQEQVKNSQQSKTKLSEEDFY